MNRSSFQLTSLQKQDVARVMAKCQRLPLYRYPWKELEETLSNNPHNQLSLVAYGSLINPQSAKRTLPQRVIRQSKPVVIFGVRRTFDYLMPEGISHYENPANPLARAALNVHLTGDIDDQVNGLLLPLSLEDIPAIRQREVEYDLVPVACVDWPNPSHAYPAYVLRSEQRINRHLEPHPAYYEICREGAAQIGEEFLSLWLHTTFLGDGKTPVTQWDSRQSELPRHAAPAPEDER